MKKIILLVSSLLLISLSSVSMAAGPGSGSMSKRNMQIGSCSADSVSVKWKLDSIMGEATVAGSLKWEGDSSCTLPASTTIWLEVTDNDGGKGYVRVSPVKPKANKGYGYNTTGSPNWGKTLCGYRGTEITECQQSSDAKRLWKKGSVSDFRIEVDPADSNRQASSRKKQKETRRNKKAATQTSAVGRWKIDMERSTAPVTITLKRDGTATYYAASNGSTYLARWSGSGSSVKMNVYSNKKFFNAKKPAITLNMRMKGNRISGVMVSHFGGAADAGLKGKRL